MTERFLVDVGAQHLGDPRIAVLRAGTDGEGAFAALLVGSYPDAAEVRLRTGRPHVLPDGRGLHLGGVAPVGRRASVALLLSDAGAGRAATAPTPG